MTKRKGDGKAAGAIALPQFSSTSEVHRYILSEINKMYTTTGVGLEDMWEALGIASSDNRAPREKITVLMIGNHSAGKSSFCNWYTDQYIQKERYVFPSFHRHS